MEKKKMKGGVFNECLLMNIFPTGCPHRQRGERRVSQMQPAAERGRGRSKISKNVLTSFMDGPLALYWCETKKVSREACICVMLHNSSKVCICGLSGQHSFRNYIYTQGIWQFLVVFSDVSSRSQKEILT